MYRTVCCGNSSSSSSTQFHMAESIQLSHSFYSESQRSKQHFTDSVDSCCLVALVLKTKIVWVRVNGVFIFLSKACERNYLHSYEKKHLSTVVFVLFGVYLISLCFVSTYFVFLRVFANLPRINADEVEKKLLRRKKKQLLKKYKKKTIFFSLGFVFDIIFLCEK